MSAIFFKTKVFFALLFSSFRELNLLNLRVEHTAGVSCNVS